MQRIARKATQVRNAVPALPCLWLPLSLALALALGCAMCPVTAMYTHAHARAHALNRVDPASASCLLIGSIVSEQRSVRMFNVQLSNAETILLPRAPLLFGFPLIFVVVFLSSVLMSFALAILLYRVHRVRISGFSVSRDRR